MAIEMIRRSGDRRINKAKATIKSKKRFISLYMLMISLSKRIQSYAPD